MYNIDGTRQKEDNSAVSNRYNPSLKQAAVQEVSMSISLGGEERPRQSQNNKQPWSYYVDKQLFGKGGEAPFKRHSAEYDDFNAFYQRYLLLIKKPSLTAELELKRVRECLYLFKDFQEKKRVKLAAVIDQARKSLPVAQYETHIIELVQNHQVVLIAADTGAGKSTQIPQYLMNAGYMKIACTQPRRIACFSLAKRVNYESMNMYSSEIAYQVRFDKTQTKETRILFLTEVSTSLTTGRLVKADCNRSVFKPI